MGYLEPLNAPIIWLMALVGIVLLIIQSILFLRKAFEAGEKMGIPHEKAWGAFKSGAISAIGPSIPLIMGAVTLIIIVGGPATWQRLGHIGSVMYELLAAGLSSQAMGIKLGGPEFGLTAAVTAIWVMTTCDTGWLIFTGLFTPSLPKIRSAISGGKEALIPVITTGCMLGAFSYFASTSILKLGGETAAWVAGGIVMISLRRAAKQFKQYWLLSWSLGIALTIGVIVGILVGS